VRPALTVFVAPAATPLTRPSGTLSPVGRGEGDEWQGLGLEKGVSRSRPEPQSRTGATKAESRHGKAVFIHDTGAAAE
jgi:hypothetical protein